MASYIPFAALRDLLASLTATAPVAPAPTLLATSPESSGCPHLRFNAASATQFHYGTTPSPASSSTTPTSSSPSSPSSSCIALPSTSTVEPFKFARYDVDDVTGFLPNDAALGPVTRLPPAYARWEQALAGANQALSLGEDNSPPAVSRRESARQWRWAFQSVSRPASLISPIPPSSILIPITHHRHTLSSHLHLSSCYSSAD